MEDDKQDIEEKKKEKIKQLEHFRKIAQQKKEEMEKLDLLLRNETVEVPKGETEVGITTETVKKVLCDLDTFGSVLLC